VILSDGFPFAVHAPGKGFSLEGSVFQTGGDLLAGLEACDIGIDALRFLTLIDPT